MRNRAKVVEHFKQAQDRLVLQAADLSLETISGMVKSKSIDLSPTYQRRERWTTEQQSTLIESFLLNIPVPPIYLAEEEFGVYSAIDGKQRITAISEFMSNRLKLVGMDTFKDINDSKFEDLPAELQNALRIRPYVRAITLLKQSSTELKYEVFTRLNRQGVPLNGQEIRNVLYRGRLNDAIYKLSENKFLHQQLKIRNKKAPAFQEMADAEYVLRFLMLYDQQKEFSGSFRRSMDSFMADRKKLSVTQVEELADVFLATIADCESIWGKFAFKRAAGDNWRDQFLAGMYDAQMLAVARSKKSVLNKAKTQADLVIQRTNKLFSSDPVFESAVREGTNTPSKLEYRITQISRLLEGADVKS